MKVMLRRRDSDERGAEVTMSGSLHLAQQVFSIWPQIRKFRRCLGICGEEDGKGESRLR